MGAGGSTAVSCSSLELNNNHKQARYKRNNNNNNLLLNQNQKFHQKQAIFNNNNKRCSNNMKHANSYHDLSNKNFTQINSNSNGSDWFDTNYSISNANIGAIRQLNVLPIAVPTVAAAAAEIRTNSPAQVIKYNNQIKTNALIANKLLNRKQQQQQQQQNRANDLKRFSDSLPSLMENNLPLNLNCDASYSSTNYSHNPNFLDETHNNHCQRYFKPTKKAILSAKQKQLTRQQQPQLSAKLNYFCGVSNLTPPSQQQQQQQKKLLVSDFNGGKNNKFKGNVLMCNNSKNEPLKRATSIASIHQEYYNNYSPTPYQDYNIVYNNKNSNCQAQKISRKSNVLRPLSSSNVLATSSSAAAAANNQQINNKKSLFKYHRQASSSNSNNKSVAFNQQFKLNKYKLKQQQQQQTNQAKCAVLPPLPRSQSLHELIQLRSTENGQRMRTTGTLRGPLNNNNNNNSTADGAGENDETLAAINDNNKVNLVAEILENKRKEKLLLLLKQQQQQQQDEGKLNNNNNNNTSISVEEKKSQIRTVSLSMSNNEDNVSSSLTSSFDVRSDNYEQSTISSNYLNASQHENIISNKQGALLEGGLRTNKQHDLNKKMLHAGEENYHESKVTNQRVDSQNNTNNNNNNARLHSKKADKNHQVGTPNLKQKIMTTLKRSLSHSALQEDDNHAYLNSVNTTNTNNNNNNNNNLEIDNDEEEDLNELARFLYQFKQRQAAKEIEEENNKKNKKNNNSSSNELLAQTKLVVGARKEFNFDENNRKQELIKSSSNDNNSSDKNINQQSPSSTTSSSGFASSSCNSNSTIRSSSSSEGQQHLQGNNNNKEVEVGKQRSFENNNNKKITTSSSSSSSQARVLVGSRKKYPAPPRPDEREARLCALNRNQPLNLSAVALNDEKQEKQKNKIINESKCFIGVGKLKLSSSLLSIVDEYHSQQQQQQQHNSLSLQSNQSSLNYRENNNYNNIEKNKFIHQANGRRTTATPPAGGAASCLSVGFDRKNLINNKQTSSSQAQALHEESIEQTMAPSNDYYYNKNNTNTNYQQEQEEEEEEQQLEQLKHYTKLRQMSQSELALNHLSNNNGQLVEKQKVQSKQQQQQQQQKESNSRPYKSRLINLIKRISDKSEVGTPTPAAAAAALAGRGSLGGQNNSSGEQSKGNKIGKKARKEFDRNHSNEVARFKAINHDGETISTSTVSHSILADSADVVGACCNKSKQMEQKLLHEDGEENLKEDLIGLSRQRKVVCSSDSSYERKQQQQQQSLFNSVSEKQATNCGVALTCPTTDANKSSLLLPNGTGTCDLNFDCDFELIKNCGSSTDDCFDNKMARNLLQPDSCVQHSKVFGGKGNGKGKQQTIVATPSLPLTAPLLLTSQSQLQSKSKTQTQTQSQQMEKPKQKQQAVNVSAAHNNHNYHPKQTDKRGFFLNYSEQEHVLEKEQRTNLVYNNENNGNNKQQQQAAIGSNWRFGPSLLVSGNAHLHGQTAKQANFPSNNLNLNQSDLLQQTRRTTPSNCLLQMKDRNANERLKASAGRELAVDQSRSSSSSSSSAAASKLITSKKASNDNGRQQATSSNGNSKSKWSSASNWLLMNSGAGKGKQQAASAAAAAALSSSEQKQKLARDALINGRKKGDCFLATNKQCFSSPLDGQSSGTSQKAPATTSGLIDANANANGNSNDHNHVDGANHKWEDGSARANNTNNNKASDDIKKVCANCCSHNNNNNDNNNNKNNEQERVNNEANQLLDDLNHTLNLVSYKSNARRSSAELLLLSKSEKNNFVPFSRKAALSQWQRDGAKASNQNVCKRKVMASDEDTNPKCASYCCQASALDRCYCCLKCKHQKTDMAGGLDFKHQNLSCACALKNNNCQNNNIDNNQQHQCILHGIGSGSHSGSSSSLNSNPRCDTNADNYQEEEEDDDDDDNDDYDYAKINRAMINATFGIDFQADSATDLSCSGELDKMKNVIAHDDVTNKLNCFDERHHARRQQVSCSPSDSFTFTGSISNNNNNNNSNSNNDLNLDLHSKTRTGAGAGAAITSSICDDKIITGSSNVNHFECKTESERENYHKLSIAVCKQHQQVALVDVKKQQAHCSNKEIINSVASNQITADKSSHCFDNGSKQQPDQQFRKASHFVVCSECKIETETETETTTTTTSKQQADNDSTLISSYDNDLLSCRNKCRNVAACRAGEFVSKCQSNPSNTATYDVKQAQCCLASRSSSSLASASASGVASKQQDCSEIRMEKSKENQGHACDCLLHGQTKKADCLPQMAANKSKPMNVSNSSTVFVEHNLMGANNKQPQLDGKNSKLFSLIEKNYLAQNNSHGADIEDNFILKRKTPNAGLKSRG